MAAVRPSLREPVLVYALCYVSLLAMVFIAAELGLPPIARLFALVLAALGGGFVFGWFILVAVYVHFTQAYDIEDKQVLIRRGLVNRVEVAVSGQNIAEVQTVMPFPLRLTRVGLIRITTNDGSSQVLLNIKNPADFAARLTPRASG